MQWEIRRRTRITEIAKGIVELAIKDRKPGPSSGKSIGGDSEYRIYQLLKRYNVKNNQLELITIKLISTCGFVKYYL